MNPHAAQKPAPVKIFASRFIEIKFLFKEDKALQILHIKILRDAESRSKAVPGSLIGKRTVRPETQNIQTAVEMGARFFVQRCVGA